MSKIYGQAGYNSPDWGMEGWYRKQEEADRQQMYLDWCVKWYRDECIAIADSLAKEYYNANGENYYDSDEEFLASDDGCWREWLIEEAREKGEHCLDAMKQLIEYNEEFTFPEYVLEVIRR